MNYHRQSPWYSRFENKMRVDKVKPNNARPSSHCPFCQGKNLKLVSDAEGRRIYQCLGCGLVSAASEIINGQLSPKAKARLRTKNYQKKVKKWLQDYLGEKPYLLARFEKRLVEIEKRKKPGKILDIGCAAGFFLELVQKHGWEVFGVDTSPEAIKYCLKTIDSSRILCGTLKEVGLQSQFFDVIVIFETLEHIPNLRSFLAEVKRVLKPDGLLALTVPNQGGLVSKLLGRRWFDYKRLQHLHFFTPETLKMVLEKASFKVLFAKQEFFHHCPADSCLTKLRRYYPHPIVNRGSLLAEKLSKVLRIKSAIIPLEHIYVIAKKS